jgi:hypothetical protein
MVTLTLAKSTIALASSLISSLKFSAPVVVMGAGDGVGVGVGAGAGAGLGCGAGVGPGVGVGDGVPVQPTANEITNIKIISTAMYFFILVLLNFQNKNSFTPYLFTKYYNE